MSQHSFTEDVDFLAKLMPTLSNALTEVALRRPKDVNAFLAFDLLKNSGFDGDLGALRSYLFGDAPVAELLPSPEPTPRPQQQRRFVFA